MIAYLRLVRLPNVFTALTDIVAGFLIACAAFGVEAEAWPPALLALVSASLYLGGMAFNDFADRDEDAQFHPQRPIPSGQITAKRALICAAALVLLGLLVAPTAGLLTAFCTQALAAAILLYNFATKGRLILGPLTLGVCRVLNVLLGMSWPATQLLRGEGSLFDLATKMPWAPAFAVGIYAAGLTAFSAQEEAGKQTRAILIGWLFTGGGLLLAGLDSPSPAVWVVLAPLAALLFSHTLKLKREGSPAAARRLVRAGVLGICALDAALILGALGARGWPYAVLCLALLFPSVKLGKWLAQKEA